MCVYICMLQGNGGNIPKFGEWKTTDGGSLYTMYFENARKRRNNSAITVPPEASAARTNTVPSGHRTPPRAPDVKPLRQQDGANSSRNQAKVSKLKRSFHMTSGGASWGLPGMACRSNIESLNPFLSRTCVRTCFIKRKKELYPTTIHDPRKFRLAKIIDRKAWPTRSLVRRILGGSASEFMLL